MFIRKYQLLLLVLAIACTCSCSCSTSKKATVIASSAEVFTAVDTFPAKVNSTYSLNKNYDLKGKTYILPAGVTIKIKNGVFKNGTLIGQNTKIEGKQPFFDKVTLKGEWNVPDISTKMFKDLDYDNSLRDVMALTNEKIKNKVTIHKGVYFFNLQRNQETGIYIRSNTSVILEGELRLKPNDYTSYHIVELTGENCSLEGSGVIIGDKDKHTGTAGEWGMGVEFSKAKNAYVSEVTIKDCWGDCIYVGDESKNIIIRNCYLDNGRRQGISITSADSVWVSDCIITNVSGTNPQFAIDVEPNTNKRCTNIFISNVRSEDCVGGFVISGNAKDAIVKGVHLSNCTVRGATNKYPLTIYKAEEVTVNGCDVESESEYTVLIEKTTSVNAHDNTFKAKGKKHFNLIHSTKLNLDNNQLIIRK